MAKDTAMTGSVLVLGGGIGGIQASLDLAEAGYKVYLMDSNPSIGGVMAMLDKTLPTNDCSMCILSPKMVEVDNHPNVELVTYSDLVEVKGKPGDFKIKILKKTRFVDEVTCTGCGACAEACVQAGKALDSFQAGISRRGAIFLPFPQAVPKLALLDEGSCLMITKGKCTKKCVDACPVGAIDFELEDREETLEVGAVILAPGLTPFDPGDLSSFRYNHPDVITSMEMERLQCASGPTGGEIRRPSDESAPRSIAWIQCVGSRSIKELPYCSGVCCAYSVKEAMIVKDHDPDIDCHIFFHDQRSFGKGYEAFFKRAQEEYGIVFHRFREPMVREGREGLTLMLEDREEGMREMPFDLVVLATGFQPPRELEAIEKAGVELNGYGFCSTLPFQPLRTNLEGVYACGAFTGPRDIPETVAQASGAAAEAMVLLSDVRGTMIAEKEYPPEKDIGNELRIGVFVCHCGTNIAATVDVEKVREYADSLPGVVHAEDNLYTCSAEGCERIKEAIEEHDLNRVVVTACTPRTHEPLFRETCREAGLNRYLFEMANIRDHCSWVHKDRKAATAKALDLVRMAISKAALLKPLPTYDIPVEPSALVIGGGLSGLTAALELAGQGFEVHLLEREKGLGGNLLSHHTTLSGEDPHDMVSELVSKAGSHEKISIHTGAELSGVSGYVGNFQVGIKRDGKTEMVKVGVIIVATGGVEYKPEEYLYGQDDRILTQSELEERLHTKGADPGTVVVIQCVGSRNRDRRYCSRVCCGLAIKNALTIKKKSPDTKVIVLYRDIMAYGFKEDYYREAREKGVIFLRYLEEEPPEVKKGKGGIAVSLRPADLDAEVELDADLVALSTAVIPSPGAGELSEMLKVPVDENGFFSEAHVKLRPVDFASDGIFLCGVAHAPKAIAENVAQAKAAAARAAVVLSKDTFVSEGAVAQVDEEACRGCGTCVEVCPFSAISLKESGEYLVAEVNPALCKHCGTCSAACLSSAIITQHFTNDQIFAMIGAEMEG
ncbi:MAG: FAD-dependent oxidoreductase [Actinomycetota bacterium]|nr:FAD-dependent oxidoreductase [Actinomycetota bacterium]